MNPADIRRDIAAITERAPEDLDPNVPLIDQGLDSLRLVNLYAQWTQAGVEIEFNDMMSWSTLADFEANLS